MAEANRINAMLRQVLGDDRFPLDVEELALEYSKQCFPNSPITKIKGDDLPGFEGMLTANPIKTKWMIVYNSGVTSTGRIRFTLAHELGHYLLHRERQDEFNCSQQDMEEWDAEGREIETEADLFASYLLMPLDDFRQQIGHERMSFDLLSHCADRYGVSMTAAALKWIEIADKRAVLVASRDDHLLWARSNRAALRSGAYFPTRRYTIEVPRRSITHSGNCIAIKQTEVTQARVWFPKEPDDMPLTEMTLVSDQYDYTLTLLSMPEAEWRRPKQDDEEPEEDTVDRFIRNGQYPVRN
jgi:Zn-dependent peptidase ImmA (M78 family)